MEIFACLATDKTVLSIFDNLSNAHESFKLSYSGYNGETELKDCLNRIGPRKSLLVVEALTLWSVNHTTEGHVGYVARYVVKAYVDHL